MRRGLLALALLCGAAGAATAQQPPAAEPAPDATVTLDVKDGNLVDVLAYVAERTGRDIRPGSTETGSPIAKAWPPVTVTVQFEEIPWRRALDVIAQAAKAEVQRDGDTWIVTRGPAKTVETVVGTVPSEQGREIHVVRAGEVRRAFTEMTSTLAGIFFILLGGFVMLCCQLLALAVFPGAVAAATHAAERGSVIPFALGLGTTLGVLIFVAVAVKLGPFGALLGTLAGVVVLGMLVVGLAGRAQTIGARLLGPERAGRALAPVALGWTVMFGVSLVPVIGWVLAAWWNISALGITVWSAIRALGGGGAGGRPPSPPGPPPAKPPAPAALQ